MAEPRAWRVHVIPWQEDTGIAMAASRANAISRGLASANGVGYGLKWTDVKATRAPEFDFMFAKHGLFNWDINHARDVAREEIAAPLNSRRTAMSEPSLKPCPFCGDTALEVAQGGDRHWVMCHGCHAEGPMRDDEAAAVEAWNRRTPAPGATPAVPTPDVCVPASPSRSPVAGLPAIADAACKGLSPNLNTENCQAGGREPFVPFAPGQCINCGLPPSPNCACPNGRKVRGALRRLHPFDPERPDDERECETCRGKGTIDMRLSAYGDSDPAAECPDCDGRGWWPREGSSPKGECPPGPNAEHAEPGPQDAPKTDPAGDTQSAEPASEREAFEAWARARHLIGRTGYSPSGKLAWEVWQAARATPPAPAPEPALRYCMACGEGVTSFCRAPVPFDCRMFKARPRPTPGEKEG